MAIRLNPYLNFDSSAREAMTFYHSILGGEITFSTFGEFGLSEDPADQDKIMHSMITAPDGLVLMGATRPVTWKPVVIPATPFRSVAIRKIGWPATSRS